jgi:hypothetical protein
MLLITETLIAIYKCLSNQAVCISRTLMVNYSCPTNTETSFLDKIIGRNREKIELSDAFNSNGAEFIAVYGRRRVGKTYLVKNFFQGKKCIYFQMTGIYKGSLNNQLSRFSKEIGEAFQ